MNLYAGLNSNGILEIEEILDDFEVCLMPGFLFSHCIFSLLL